MVLQSMRDPGAPSFRFQQCASRLASDNLAFMRLVHPSQLRQFSRPSYVKPYSGTCKFHTTSSRRIRDSPLGFSTKRRPYCQTSPPGHVALIRTVTNSFEIGIGGAKPSGLSGTRNLIRYEQLMRGRTRWYELPESVTARGQSLTPSTSRVLCNSTLEVPRDVWVHSAETVDLSAMVHSDLAESRYLAMKTSSRSQLHFTNIRPYNRRGC
jgi:hypothetical protein